MDTARTRQTLSSQDAAAAHHEQSIQIGHQNLTALARFVDSLVQLLGQSTILGAADNRSEGKTLVSVGVFVLQCWLVFLQRAFPSDSSKITTWSGCCRDECWLGHRLLWVPSLTTFLWTISSPVSSFRLSDPRR